MIHVIIPRMPKDRKSISNKSVQTNNRPKPIVVPFDGSFSPEEIQKLRLLLEKMIPASFKLPPEDLEGLDWRPEDFEQAISSTGADVPKEPVNLRLDPADIRALDVIAKKSGISRTAVISIACKRIIKSGI